MRIEFGCSVSHPYFTTKGQTWEAVLSVITKMRGESHARNAAAPTLRMTASAGITGGNGGRTHLSSAGAAGTGRIRTRVWKRPGQNGTANTGVGLIHRNRPAHMVRSVIPEEP